MTASRIYLDHAATTPLDPQVRAAILPYLEDQFGNPSSVHQEGQNVRRALDAARDTLAAAIGADASEIYFTSGGTEADNLAIIGTLLAGRESGKNHLVTTASEHHAVLDAASFAEKMLGFSVTRLPVDQFGRVAASTVANAITGQTALISVMHANNEIGTIQPIAEIAAVCRARGVLLHTDAVQTLGQMPLGVNTLGVDLLTISAHKIYGPKGVGALYVRRGVRIVPWLHGGQQEREKRAGTENVSGIVGFGEAVKLLSERRASEAARVGHLRDQLQAAVLRAIPDAILNGHPTERLSNNLNLSFPGADGETLLLALDLAGVAASSGSACASGSIEPSHVLLALGLPLPLARAAVRFSLGRTNTEEEITRAAKIIAEVVQTCRS